MLGGVQQPASGIFIALGTNLGDREQNLLRALQLCEGFLRVKARSSIYENPALLPENAPASWDIAFYNQVIMVESDLAPTALLEDLKKVETQMGREQKARWAPRIIDLDIVAYHNLCQQTKALSLPHPQMHVRDFVLKPLCDIAPEWRFPAGHALAGKTAQSVLDTLPTAFSTIGQETI